MRLARLSAEGYRCLDGLSISFDRTTVLIGGNGAGKTSVLEAIDKVFGVGRRSYGFREEDLAPGTAQLKVVFEIRPDDDETFSQEEHALFETHVDLDDSNSEVVCIAATAGFDEDGVFRSHGHFRKADGAEDGAFDAATRSQLAFFYLPATRDAQREFDDRGGLWGRLAGLLESAHDGDLLETLTAEAGRDLVSAVLGQKRLDDLATTVSKFVAPMYGQAPVAAELRATSIDFRTLLRQTSLVLGQEGALTPLEHHSTGLQTLALFGLFRAYLQTSSGHLLASGLEEPEVHLSPHVTRALIALATEEGDQVIFTTHSPAVSDRMKIGEVRLLRRAASKSVAREVPAGLFTAEEGARLQRELRTVGTEFLFARAALLCEGPSEGGALPEFASKMGLDLDRLGISVLPVGGGGFRPYLQLLGPSALDLPHAVVCDNDLTLDRLAKVLGQLGRLPDGVQQDVALGATQLEALRVAGYFAWAEGDLEAHLVAQGGYPAFTQAATFLYGPGDLETFRAARIAEGVPDDDATILALYTKQRKVRKPELAAEAARNFTAVPEPVERVLNHVVLLAAGAPADEPDELIT